MSTDYQLSERRMSALSEVDSMPPELRRCVHEFGMPIVETMLRHGISSPTKIRDIVRECWNGARQAGQRSGVRNTLDFLLSRGPVSEATLRRVLKDNSLVIVSSNPTRAMLNASLNAVTWDDRRMSREEKHRRRLRAALRAAQDQGAAG